LSDIVRLLLTLLLAGVAVTVAGGWLAWWFDEERRLKRLVKRALGGAVDAAIVARGRGAAAGFSVEGDKIVVMSRSGAAALLYRLDAVDGAELIVDHEVVGRVFRGEGRRPLDRLAKDAESITLRLIFNDIRNPDFDLDLWRAEDAERRHAPAPSDLIHEARSWLARIDALVRRSPPSRVTAPAAVAAAPAGMEAPPWDEDEEP
jgi:hypothetical protein